MVLRVPENSDDLDDGDLGCSWEKLVAKQHRGDFGEITKQNLQEGDTLAMLDRDCITKEFTRRVFVLVASEDYVLIFDESGAVIDDPGNFVEGGWQKLHGDHSFLEEWTDDGEDGYYRLVPPPAEETSPVPYGATAPAPTAAPAPAAAGLDGAVSDIMVVNARVSECFKVDNEDTVGKWFGGMVVAVNEHHCLIAFYDGDLDEHSLEQVKWLHAMGKLTVQQDERGQVSDESLGSLTRR